jgi:Protein of unknown function (DUF763)
MLGTAIAEHIVLAYGPSEFLTRLSDLWFQALGCVMGMDWHSSGITTSVMGALKQGLNPRFSELGIAVCGGRGRHSVRTLDSRNSRALYFVVGGWPLSRATPLCASARAAVELRCCMIRGLLAAPGSAIYELHTDLRSDDNADASNAVSTALSPGGTTLLVLTSGYNTGFKTDTGAAIVYPVLDPTTEPTPTGQTQGNALA